MPVLFHRLVTVKTVESEIPPDAALMVVVPVRSPVALPSRLILATDVFDDDHVTSLVMFLVLPSEYVPVALNCSEAPLRIDGFVGVTVTLTSVGGHTNRSVESEIAPSFALIFAKPMPTPDARPVLSIVATDSLEDDQVTLRVMSCVLPSL